jgi:hypothetical protein
MGKQIVLFFQKKTRNKYHFHLICYADGSGFQSIVMQSDRKTVTPNKLVLFAIENGLPADVTIVAVSYLGRMSELAAKTE